MPRPPDSGPCARPRDEDATDLVAAHLRSLAVHRRVMIIVACVAAGLIVMLLAGLSEAVRQFPSAALPLRM